MGEATARDRLLLPWSIPRPVLSALGSAAPQPGWPWEVQGRRRSTQGTPRCQQDPARARHSESGAVESEDQHEKEMEDKEQ